MNLNREVKPEMHSHNIYKFSSSLIENTLRPHYKSNRNMKEATLSYLTQWGTAILGEIMLTYYLEHSPLKNPPTISQTIYLRQVKFSVSVVYQKSL
jgi:hypothetical protein